MLNPWPCGEDAEGCDDDVQGSDDDWQQVFSSMLREGTAAVGRSSQHPQGRPVKYLEHMKKVEFYELYKMHANEIDKTIASITTFIKVWQTLWSRCLKIRKILAACEMCRLPYVQGTACQGEL